MESFPCKESAVVFSPPFPQEANAMSVVEERRKNIFRSFILFKKNPIASEKYRFGMGMYGQMYGKSSEFGVESL